MCSSEISYATILTDICQKSRIFFVSAQCNYPEARGIVTVNCGVLKVTALGFGIAFSLFENIAMRKWGYQLFIIALNLFAKLAIDNQLVKHDRRLTNNMHHRRIFSLAVLQSFWVLKRCDCSITTNLKSPSVSSNVVKICKSMIWTLVHALIPILRP